MAPLPPPKTSSKKTKAAPRSGKSRGAKIDQLATFTSPSDGAFLTTNQGLRISDNQNSLKAGPRGPTLLEDFIMREKITHFDHERIPERIVHARGNAAHGFFEVYKSMKDVTKAGFLADPSVKTPVFVRFSTVAGSRGSADTPRDVRGFAVKFYTQEGNFDLVGNNMPVFFIQDAIKFPDLIHAVKPEPNKEIPQAASAHDTFYDFITSTPEATHMMLWVMSDRALPRSQRMMEGFGVHTFRFVNAKGVARFVKFHWKPLLGVHSLAWDESQKLAGQDPDFLRRDLFDAIEAGAFPEWELGVQIVEEKDEHKFEFDLLDSTKLIPEELVPVQRIGKMTLNRNPDNYFAETEQVAFHLGHVVPGIDFSNDPLLQGRLFSYTDTQISRLGGANFHELPINRPVCPFNNNQRDGMHRMTIVPGQVSYDRNVLAGGYPKEASPEEHGFVSYAERIDANKVRGRSASFGDYFSQATLFWNSQSPAEKQHIVEGFQFELAKLEVPALRNRMVGLLTQVDIGLAERVAEVLGVNVAAAQKETARFLSDAKRAVKEVPSGTPERKRTASPVASRALSMDLKTEGTIVSRKIAVLASDGVDGLAVAEIKRVLEKNGAVVKIVAPKLGNLKASRGDSPAVDHTLVTMPSVVFDAVFIAPGAQSSKALSSNADAVHFVREAFKHCKAIGSVADIELCKAAGLPETKGDPGIVSGDNLATVLKAFIVAVGKHRNWQRNDKTIAA